MNELPYGLEDALYLWWLADPGAPVLVGELNLVRAARGVSLRYADPWLAAGFALSEDLPLMATEHLPEQKDRAVGAVDDARPDRWGERVIRVIDRPPRLSLLEYLYFAGDDRFGALGVSSSATSYLPRSGGPLPSLDDAEQVQALVLKVLANEPVAPEQRRLISPGGSMGGARPKALLEIDGAQWVVKFGAGDPVDLPLVEHAAMSLARRAAIRTATTRPIPLIGGHAVAVGRFDRSKTVRFHCLSAKVALEAAGEALGYPELAQLLRRRGVVDGGAHLRQMAELFRRMVFNILIDNTDDHEKNHALIINDAQQYELSPAFDVLPTGQALGVQQMRVGSDEGDATLDNALSECELFGLSRDAAAKQIRQVIAVVDNWIDALRDCGVTRGDIDLLAEQIDRSFLIDQRRAF